MKHPNLSRRGHLFWWRRKVTIDGVAIPIALPLHTANFYQARAIAERLGSGLEALRMSYGERGTAIDPANLKLIFQDAMRWQLTRILQDQIGSVTPVAHHAFINKVCAELWRHSARSGPETPRTAAYYAGLIDAGWTPEEVKVLAQEAARYSGALVSQRQLETYAERFGFPLTTSNRQQLTQVVLSARAHACDAATAQLGQETGDLSAWVEEALAAEGPFLFERVTDPVPGPPAAATGQPSSTTTTPARPTAAPEASSRPGKPLKQAMAECIAAANKTEAWSSDVLEQVRTAIRLFDFACGEDVLVEQVTKAGVLAFKKLCEDLPNRWGRTRAEMQGGLRASLERAKDMDPTQLGMSQVTIRKHLTWIMAVLDFAASDAGGNHEPTEAAVVEKAIREVRKGFGKKGGKSGRQRARDLRAGWNRDEIARLLSAPIWTGCRDLDHRLEPGSEVFHDGWYWLTLMLPLYGGRSSELVALPLADVHEENPIPYFQVDYTDLRALKNVQSVRDLPIHPELIRLGFIDYVRAIRDAHHTLLFPELHSTRSKSFASTFYKSVFQHWRKWAFPNGTDWRHQARGAIRDKDVHSFRSQASTMMKGKVADSVRIDILGHEGDKETLRTYDDEAALELKLEALKLLSPLTEHIPATPLRIRPAERLVFGAPRGRPSHASS
jgi:integrase